MTLKKNVKIFGKSYPSIGEGIASQSICGLFWKSEVGIVRKFPEVKLMIIAKIVINTMCPGEFCERRPTKIEFIILTQFGA